MSFRSNLGFLAVIASPRPAARAVVVGLRRLAASAAIRHAGLVVAGCALVLVQGQAAAQQANALPQVLSGVNARFQGAQLPVVTGNTMVINQVADKATLHWQSFNVGADSTVEFKQPSESSVALNRIFDAAPSQVNGKLTANGQVYLINQNGIVFGENAQVNTQSLVASTLDIDDRVYEEIGFVNAINDPSGALPAFDSFGRPMGGIHVEQGARIGTAKTGRVLIFAPTIVNEGTISTPEGQQVLAAVQDKVLIAASDDPDLRGLLVEVSTGGDVTNLGNLIAERGNISLIGLAVNQEGVARATTSVSLNGSVRLLAQDMNGTLALGNDLVPRKPKPVRGGDLTLGAGSVTEVLPDATPDEKGAEIRVVDAQSQPLSQVEIAGTRVRLESGARVTATGGNIDVTAAANPGQPDLAQPGDPANYAAELVIEQGAIVDASGDDTTVAPVSRNIVNVDARGNELADSPVQRDGPIRNETLQVDVRRGTDFLDISGAAASITRSAAERQSAGGSVRFRSEGGFVLEQGATVDVSGGQVTYTEGFVNTSRLQQANGRVVDISTADPDETYLGVAAGAPVLESGYVEGKDAGSLTLQARGLDLGGEIRAGTTAGVNQRRRPTELSSNTPAWARPWDEAPRNGALALTQLRSGLAGLVVGTPPAGTAGLGISPEWLAASGASRIGLVNAGPILVNGSLSLAPWSELSLTGTQVSVDGDVRIAGGTLAVSTTNSLVGAATVPDGELLATIAGTVDLSGTWVNDNPVINRQRPSTPIVLDGGRLVVDSGASIAVGADSVIDVSAGAWRAADGSLTGGRGGSLSFATGSVANDLAAGARLDIAGELRAFGFAGGGDLRIDSERVRVVAADGSAGEADVALDGSRQFALRPVTGQAGTQYVLEVAADTFRQGGFSSYRLSSSRSDLEVGAGAEVVLSTAGYQLTADNPALARSGTDVDALATPVFGPAFARPPASLALVATEDLGNAIGPVAHLHIAAGARIVADAGSTVSLDSTTVIDIDGSIEAPAGRIEVTLGGGPGIFQPEQAIRLGAGAVLKASGTALVNDLDPRGFVTGEVLDAGSVVIRADQGSIIGEAGARIAVDGAVATLDTGFGAPLTRRTVAGAAGNIELTAAESLFYLGSLGGAAPAGFTVPGGSLTVGIDPSRRGVPPLFGADGIPRGPHKLVFGDFTGELPAAGAPVDAQYQATGFVPLAALRAGGFASLELVARSSATGSSDTGAPVPDTPQSLPVIEFRDELDLSLSRSIRLDAAVLSTGSAQVSLAAPYVGIGYGDSRVALDGAIPDKTSATNPQETTTPIRLTPTAGDGLLRIAGELVEFVGEAVTQGFGDAAAGRDGVVVESAGDVRMRGVRTTLQSDYGGLFRTAGNLRIDAARIYPTTLTSFEVAVEGPGGRITLGGGGASAAPLSVGGSLRLAADEIVQGGALYAPLGELDFDAGSVLRFAAGSLTSTSAAGLRAPFFRTEPGGALIVPAPGAGEDQLVFVGTVTNPEFERALPEKRINLTAPEIELAAGSLFDLRGGSDVAATEFVPGPGGSLDILLADLDGGTAIDPNESFAILPGAGAYAPWDPLESPDAANIQGLRIGDTLVLEDGIAGLPAGEYAILPARYALFGGFLVTPQSGFTDLGAGAGLQRTDGTPILAGRLGVAGSDAAAGRSQGFAVEDGTRVRRRAEYLLTPLDELYAGSGVRAPLDAGSLRIEAGERLDLSGELVRDGTAAGLGSAVDIATSAALAVVDQLTGASGIELAATDLANLGADSLLLGGTRSTIDGGLRIEATSSEVSVAAGVELDLPELIIAADRIVVDAGPGEATRLVSSQAGDAATARLRVEEDAAVLALSGRQLAFERAVGDGASSIAIAAGATVDAGGGVVVDAAGDVDADGTIGVRGGVLSLGAARVSLGETDGQAIDAGLVLSNADLAAIAGSDLRLRSGSTVDLYGTVADPVTGDPLSFARLAIDARAIRGFAGATSESAVLSAGAISLANGAGAAPDGPAPVPAQGSALRLASTGTIALGDGSLAIQGYEATTLAAPGGIVLAGDGGLGVDGALAIDAPAITAAVAANSTISAAGQLTVTGTGTVPAAGAGLGAALVMEAADIDFAGRIVLPSGTVRLLQRGDADAPVAGPGLRVGAGAVIDVAGDTLAYGPKQVGTPGGTIELAATTGDVEIGAGALLDVSGATAGGEAGELALRAPLGAVRFDETAVLRGADAAGTGGRFALDAATLASPNPATGNALTALGGLLEAGGFRDTRAVRLREQDVAVDAGTTWRAREIRLAADTGRVDVAGTLDASGARAGGIWLAAGDGLAVTGLLDAHATAAGADGGRVDLVALDADGDDADGVAGEAVSLGVGAVVDVGAGEGGDGGTLLVHGRRLDSDGDGQTDRLVLGELAGEVRGADRAQLVATRVLRDPGAVQVADPGTGAPVTRVTVTAAEIESWRSETEAFLAGLAIADAGPLQVVGGLQVESSGDLVLQDRWNFMEGWHFGEDLSDPTAPRTGLAGTVTLRAARDLDVQADLTDAFAEQYLFGFLPFDGVTGAVQRLDASGAVVEEIARPAWGLRLAAGADLGSADVTATRAGVGDLALAGGARVRTGTADVDLVAGGDVRLAAGAAVYSAGFDRGLSAELRAAIDPILGPQGVTAYDLFGTFLNGGQFADGGGNVTIRAGGGLVADAAAGEVTAWLTRVGSGQVTATTLYSATEGFGAVPTHWGVAFNEFRNGVGAFGGGDISIAVGGDVTNVVLAAPTTGRVRDGVVAESAGGTLQFLPSARATEIIGGGNVTLRSGGSFDGASLVLGRGTATLATAGGTGNAAASRLYVGGDARVDWVAGGSLVLGGLQDPTVAALSGTQIGLLAQLFSVIDSTADIDNRFFTYTDGSRISIASLGGDVSLDGAGFSGFLPPSLTAVAHGGDVNVVATPLDFFPSATGTLELLARGNVTGNFSGSTETRLRQSDQDTTLLPSVDRPDITAGAPVPARVPVHTGDPVPNLVVARDGSIQSRPGSAGFWTMEFAKPAVLRAGTDISNLSVRVQHIDADDTSSFQAGRDIVQGELRDNTGRFAANDRRIFEIWGPGSAEFFAFRDISLGTSAGIESIGNSRNSALAAEGAAIRLIAGTGSDPAYDRFIDVYLSSAPSAYRDEVNAFLAEIDAGRAGYAASSEKTSLAIGAGEYTKALGEFLAGRGIAVEDGDAVATFRALDRTVQREFLTDVLFAELETWGSESETPDRADRLNYARGFTALDTLFELDAPLGDRADDFAPGEVRQAVQSFLTITDPQAANDAQVDLFGALFPPGERKGDVSLLLSQVQTLAGGVLSIVAPGGDINAGAADADIIDKQPADLGLVTARGGDIRIAVDRDLLVNSTRVFALQGDLLAWSSNGNIDAGKGAKTVTSVPDPITRIDPNTGNTIIEFPPAVSGSGLQGENAALFAPRGAVNAGDAGIRTSGDLTIGAVEIVGTDNIDVGGVEIGFSTTDVVAVAPPNAASASSAATKGVESQAGLLSEENALGERTILGTDVTFISVEVLSFGDGDCQPGDEGCER